MSEWSIAVSAGSTKSDKRKQRSKKVYAKHKMLVIGGAGDDEANEILHKHLFKSVRNKVLQKLLLVNFMCLECKSSPIYRELWERYKNKNRTNENPLAWKNINNNLYPSDLLEVLKPEDVMKVIGCNRRTATEYKDTLDSIHSGHMSVCQ
jgi:hypothetical protein